MNKKMDLCVIIPVHKPLLSVNEKVSLIAAHSKLKAYDVFLCHPSGMDISAYIEISPDLIAFEVPKEWLSSIEAYNQMKISIEFYLLFKTYNFMLTYELDSYIFSTDWNKANAYNYDYIGAPWFSGYNSATEDSSIIGIGNSGFSIRNIQKCIRILKARAKVKKTWVIFKSLQLHRIVRLSAILAIFNPIWNIRGKNVYFFSLFTENHINEDNFWCLCVPQLFHFKKAEICDSIAFSFEVNPHVLHIKNDYNLPLGCHAWEKYNLEFWKNYIK